MVHERLDTSDLPVEDRFAAWTELAVKAHVPTKVDSAHRNDFVASIEALDLGLVQVSRMSYPPLRARRPATMESLSADVLLLAHVARGAMTVTGSEHVVSAPAGHVVAVSVPGTFTVVNPVPITDTILQLPTSVLGLRHRQVMALAATPLTTHEGVGGVLAYVFNDLLRNGDTYEPAVVAQLTSTVVDLLGTAARLAETGGPPNGMALPGRGRLLQIYLFIQRNLDDPGLNPELVAAAHGISVRQLNRIFDEDGQSPAEWIRRQRLERCRRDLLDPTLAARPVGTIGMRWGFADPATFNRAFRREFGLPPGEYRRRFGIDSM